MDIPQGVGVSDQDLQAEISDQRSTTLYTLLVALPLLSWVWVYYAVSLRHDHLRSSVPALIICLAALAANKVRSRSHRLACWLLILAVMAATCSLRLLYPAPLIITLGVLPIIIASALFDTVGTVVITLLVWMLAILSGYGVSAFNLVSQRSLETLAFYGLIWAGTYLITRTLHDSMELALGGWARARDALLEARERRAELYRVVRALEEATYRIERMNSELIVARSEAEEARALKARFVTTVSHELRGPLNLILGFSRLMALMPKSYDEPLPRSYRADVYAIYRNSQHLMALVNDVLDLSQIEAQRLPLIKDRVNLEEDVVQRAIEIVEPLATRKGLALRTELAGGLPWVLADVVRLRQTLLNLLTNAVRLTERGAVIVRTGLRDDRVQISVQDTGPGIPEADIPKLFREFSQVGAKETGGAAGSGLGLAISKQLIQLHGGEIWVESQVGEGTTFHFTVPLPGLDPLTVAPLQRRDGHLASATSSCLVVHDDADVIRLLGRHITDFRLVGLPDPQEIGSLVRELHPRAIITSGAWRDAIRLQLARTDFDIPLIVCDLPERGAHGTMAGILGYLVKPVAPETLMAMMKRVERNGEMTVLLVDDDPDAVRMMERMLTSLPHPYRLFTAYDGAEALATMRVVKPDIVFLDLVMPELDGWQVAGEMRSDERLRAVPIVIISARDWIDHQTTLGTMLRVEYERPIPITHGIALLQAILTAAAPDYLPDVVMPPESPKGLPV